jgi:hypothetical protein
VFSVDAFDWGHNEALPELPPLHNHFRAVSRVREPLKVVSAFACHGNALIVCNGPVAAFQLNELNDCLMASRRLDAGSTREDHVDHVKPAQAH